MVVAEIAEFSDNIGLELKDYPELEWVAVEGIKVPSTPANSARFLRPAQALRPVAPSPSHQLAPPEAHGYSTQHTAHSTPPPLLNGSCAQPCGQSLSAMGRIGVPAKHACHVMPCRAILAVAAWQGMAPHARQHNRQQVLLQRRVRFVFG